MTSTFSDRPSWWRVAGAGLAAWLLAAVWGTVVQTQFNLNALAAIDVAIPWRLRALTTWQDLLDFGPLYAAVLLAAWLPAFGVAWLLARRLPTARTFIYALAAGAGLVAAIRSIDALAPMPVFIDATRDWSGLSLMTLGSVIGGALFAAFTPPDRR